MFIAHLKDGRSYSEDSTTWDLIPDKETISALQIVHTPSDLLDGLHSQLIELKQLLSTEHAVLCEESIDLLERLQGSRRENTCDRQALVKSIQFAGIVGDWSRELKLAREEVKVIESVNGDKVDLDKAKDAEHRLSGGLSLLKQVQSDASLLPEFDKHVVSLTGSDEHHYFFFQMKEGEISIRVSNGVLGKQVNNPCKYQIIGMIVDSEGHCVCAKMQMLTGWIKVFYTTVQSLKLNLEAYPYINLDVMK